MVVGAIAAAVHLALMAFIFAPAQRSEGSWQGFQAFLIDFPISILFVKGASAGALPWLHATIGTLWWFLLAWSLVRTVQVLAFRLRQDMDKDDASP